MNIFEYYNKPEELYGYGLSYMYKDRDDIEHWVSKNKPHREDGPAIIWDDGGKEYYLNGERHREDGPAQEYPDGSEYWYLHGKYIRSND